MVNVFINDADFFPLRCFDPVGNDLNGTVGAVQLANPATGTAMLVIFIMRHDHFPFEPLRHFECFPVFRVLLRNDLPWTEEIFSGDTHTRK
jgi:hypothetical protein